ncbi:MAG: hypothetical protein V4480_03865 [Patescibacteria group bacterium]
MSLLRPADPWNPQTMELVMIDGGERISHEAQCHRTQSECRGSQLECHIFYIHRGDLARKYGTRAVSGAKREEAVQHIAVSLYSVALIDVRIDPSTNLIATAGSFV